LAGLAAQAVQVARDNKDEIAQLCISHHSLNNKRLQMPSLLERNEKALTANTAALESAGTAQKLLPHDAMALR
jgi:hypothetical protein